MENNKALVKNCPLCNGQKCYRRSNSSSNYILFECTRFNRQFSVGSMIDCCSNKDEKRRLENLIFEYVIRTPVCDDTHWSFFYEPSYTNNENDDKLMVNLANIPYPQSFSEKTDRVLLNLHHIYPEYSDRFSKESSLARAVFSDSDIEDSDIGFLSVLADLGYLYYGKDDDDAVSAGNRYRISSTGWKRIEELTREDSGHKRGFIAMSFSEDTRRILLVFYLR